MIRVLLIINLVFLINSAHANNKYITIASTTSTHDTGLLEYINKEFESKYQTKVRALSLGTGQAIKVAMDGNVEILLVHHKKSELEFMNKGYGTLRHDLMYNDFVILGPSEDPAEISDSRSAEQALNSIFKFEHNFISRGDNSGTHKKEKKLWEKANIEISDYSGKWYKETGSGMGTTLNIAAELNSYTLSDRATWITFKNKKNLKILYEGDKNLFNQYGAILVNPEKCPHTNVEESKIFLDWLLSKNGQDAIQKYKVNGIQLFYPNAN